VSGLETTSSGVLVAKDILKRTAIKRIRKIKEVKPKVSSTSALVLL
jgi:hypothetical protein